MITRLFSLSFNTAKDNAVLFHHIFLANLAMMAPHVRQAHPRILNGYKGQHPRPILLRHLATPKRFGKASRVWNTS